MGRCGVERRAAASYDAPSAAEVQAARERVSTRLAAAAMKISGDAVWDWSEDASEDGWKTKAAIARQRSGEGE